jgi:CYTH domain-containing protein
MSALTPGKEFERKFLVRVGELPRGLLKDGQYIEQGYLSLDPLVRLRLIDGEGIMEFKGDKNVELELCRVSIHEGRRILRERAVQTASIVEKERFEVPAGFDGLKWEIDFFHGQNDGLVVVELEMPRKRYSLKSKPRPAWVGLEVTNDPRFKNKNLAVHPFCAWSKRERRKILGLMGV